ncbi:MAG: AAA family ATPase [Gemmatimonadetes bacterium]|nr:AAA family ATPase [Gemmatimonadota bacterium]MYI63638.1 AAA family ATPase [Gemmatimonadota bacterium]
MDLELKIENFGPIDKATIRVGQFTVFAGPNNTGKTFVAKMLYSFLNARNANHTLVFFRCDNPRHRIGSATSWAKRSRGRRTPLIRN